MRNIPSELDPRVVADIDAMLSAVETENGVTILHAVESGSRAWGFPSPDSDYDARFIYVRPLDDYLSLRSFRDVIERAPDAIFDVNGWDLAKALKLLLKGNAVVIEWLLSPIVYRGVAGFRDDMLALAREVARRDLLQRHYLRLGFSMRNRLLGDPDGVKLKKIFYALRPALALRWLERHTQEKFPPMDYASLVAASGVPAGVREIAEDLLAQKARTREMGTGEAPRELLDFIDAEFSRAENAQGREQRLSAEAIDAADVFFRTYVKAQLRVKAKL